MGCKYSNCRSIAATKPITYLKKEEKENKVSQAIITRYGIIV